jgi:hypothetical protein
MLFKIQTVVIAFLSIVAIIVNASSLRRIDETVTLRRHRHLLVLGDGNQQDGNNHDTNNSNFVNPLLQRDLPHQYRGLQAALQAPDDADATVAPFAAPTETSWGDPVTIAPSAASTEISWDDLTLWQKIFAVVFLCGWLICSSACTYWCCCLKGPQGSGRANILRKKYARVDLFVGHIGNLL